MAERLGPGLPVQPSAARPRKDELVVQLRDDPWLATLPEPLRERIVAAMVVRCVAQDRPVYLQGDPCDGLYRLISGRMRLERFLNAGEDGVLFTIGPGFWLGALAPLTGGKREVSATATADSVLLLLPQREIDAILATEVTAWRALSALLAKQMVGALDLLTERLILSLPMLVARRLLRLSVEGYGLQDPARAAVILHQAELAAMLGVTRKAVNGVLRGFARAGIVELRKGRVVIRDVARLTRAAQAPESL